METHSRTDCPVCKRPAFHHLTRFYCVSPNQLGDIREAAKLPGPRRDSFQFLHNNGFWRNEQRRIPRCALFWPTTNWIYKIILPRQSSFIQIEKDSERLRKDMLGPGFKWTEQWYSGRIAFFWLSDGSIRRNY